MRTTMWKYILAWVPMVLIAIANGALREIWYKKYLGELPAHQVSVASGILLFGIYIWALFRIWRLESASQAIVIGLSWLGLTVAFEFVFGHYVRGFSWNVLLHDYNIFAGRLWVAVLLWITAAPYIFFKLQK